MTRKDYVKIANQIRNTTEENALDIDTWVYMVQAVGDALQDDNDAFNRAMFYNACGWEYVFGSRLESLHQWDGDQLVTL